MTRHILLAILAVFTLSACEGAREAIGIGKQSPDEFAVVTRAPRPGAERPQESTVKETARDLLVESSGASVTKQELSDASKGEVALLARAGATNPDPAIRRTINRESSILATEDDSFADRLIFWQSRPPPGTLVDAAAEQKRLRENAGLGDAPTKGRTPQIIRKPKGWFEGIF